MTVLRGGETETVVGVECWQCDRDYFAPLDDRAALEACPYCGATDGQGIQGIRMEVRA